MIIIPLSQTTAHTLPRAISFSFSVELSDDRSIPTAVIGDIIPPSSPVATILKYFLPLFSCVSLCDTEDGSSIKSDNVYWGLPGLTEVS